MEDEEKRLKNMESAIHQYRQSAEHWKTRYDELRRQLKAKDEQIQRVRILLIDKYCSDPDTVGQIQSIAESIKTKQIKDKDVAKNSALRLLSPWLADLRRGRHVCSDSTVLDRVEQLLKGGD